MKVVHRFGPCSARSQGKAMSELVLDDEPRVRAIKARVKSLKLGKNKGGIITSESETANLPVGGGGGGNYFATVGLGTPKKELDLLFDTGSHITWTQCKPCAGKCYPQRVPIFDPAASTTYSNITCSSPSCSALLSATNNPPLCVDSNACVYQASYGDPTFSVGVFGKDRLALTSTDVVDGFLFGCGQQNYLYASDSAGLMGLGRDTLSIVSQTSQQYGKYFSYCLPTITGSDGHLTFGQSTRTNYVKLFTPLLSSQTTTEFYFIDVLDISVGGRQLGIDPTVFKNSGTIIDSGTVITRLPPAAYTALSDAFRQKMMTMYKPATNTTRFDNCYDLSKYSNLEIPTISFTFGGNVVVDLDPRGLMLSIDQNGSEVCLAFLPNEDAREVGIFGNLQQQTLDVVYDVAGGKLGFASGGCS